MSIGLPTWLLDKENQIYVITTYLLIFVVIFPVSLLLYARRASKVTDSKLHPDTEEIYRMGIRQVVSMQSIIDCFANAAEFRVLNYRGDDERNEIIELRKMLIASSRMPSKPAVHFFPMPKSVRMFLRLMMSFPSKKFLTHSLRTLRIRR